MDAASEVIKRIEADDQLRQQLSTVSDAVAARSMLASAGVTMTDEQFASFKTKFESGEVSEEDLERVAGGGAGTWIATTGTVVGAAAAAAAAL